jgi:hypothetical protein
VSQTVYAGGGRSSVQERWGVMQKTIEVHDLLFRDSRGRVHEFTLMDGSGCLLSHEIDKISVFEPLPSLEDFLEKNGFILMPYDTIMPYWNVSKD